MAWWSVQPLPGKKIIKRVWFEIPSKWSHSTNFMWIFRISGNGNLQRKKKQQWIKKVTKKQKRLVNGDCACICLNFNFNLDHIPNFHLSYPIGSLFRQTRGFQGCPVQSWTQNPKFLPKFPRFLLIYVYPSALSLKNSFFTCFFFKTAECN